MIKKNDGMLDFQNWINQITFLFFLKSVSVFYFIFSHFKPGFRMSLDGKCFLQWKCFESKKRLAVLIFVNGN